MRVADIMGGTTSFKPCVLISSPSPPRPSSPLPYPPTPSFPPFPSPPFPSRVEGSQSHLPPPSLYLPFLLTFPRGSYPLSQPGDLGSAISSPVRSGAKPQLTNNLVHIRAKRSSSAGNSFCAFLKNKCNFLRL